VNATVVVALIGGLVTIVGVIGTYLVSRRTLSSSGARLRADLEILEKAKHLGVEPAVMEAILRRVRWSAEQHAGQRGLNALFEVPPAPSTTTQAAG
jgi:hypothetical protein